MKQCHEFLHIYHFAYLFVPARTPALSARELYTRRVLVLWRFMNGGVSVQGGRASKSASRRQMPTAGGVLLPRRSRPGVINMQTMAAPWWTCRRYAPGLYVALVSPFPYRTASRGIKRLRRHFLAALGRFKRYGRVKDLRAYIAGVVTFF